MATNGSRGARAATVIVPTLGGERLERLLASLDPDQPAIVVHDGTGDGVEAIAERHRAVEPVRAERGAGLVGAINLAARGAESEAIVLLDDDCVCEPGFVERLTAPLDPAAGVVMAAAVLRDWRRPELIDSAGMELDEGLLPSDYLNGEPLERLDTGVADPIGPSAAAAAFDRATFLAVGGFDGRLLAYGEDVDLVLRLRRLGFSCRLAPDARADYERPQMPGSGSPHDSYMTGFGRGYVLRKWSVLNGRRFAPVLAREAAVCVGEAVADGSVTGTRGRLRGYRDADPSERYPSMVGLSRGGRGAAARRRARAGRRRGPHQRPASRLGGLHSLAVFHVSGTSGPSRSLETELAWLAEQGSLDVAIPRSGMLSESLSDSLGDGTELFALDYEALTRPAPKALVAEAWRLRRDVRTFRGLIRRRGPRLVIAVTTMLPAVLIAAWLEGVPALVYCGELFDRRHRGGFLRTFASQLVAGLTARTADGIIACSAMVAAQFPGSRGPVQTVYPPVSERYSGGDGGALRAAHGIPTDAAVLASVGNITEGRGQDVLVRAMPAILERLPEARYVIAGDPFPRPQDVAFRDRLLELIDELDLAESVIVTGHVEEIADVYAAADVIVNPARFNEPFGRVPFEAAIAGKPAIVTRVGAIPELLTDGTSALIVPPEDPDALAGAALRLLDDPELGATLVAGARRVVDERLTPSHSLAGFRQAVERVLEGTGAGALGAAAGDPRR